MDGIYNISILLWSDFNIVTVVLLMVGVILVFQSLLGLILTIGSPATVDSGYTFQFLQGLILTITIPIIAKTAVIF